MNISPAKQLCSLMPIPNDCFVDHRNRRLIINDYHEKALCQEMVNRWISLARQEKLEKIWIWAYFKSIPQLIKWGFQLEGVMPDNLMEKPVASMACYLAESRGRSMLLAQEDAIIKQVIGKPIEDLNSLPDDFQLRYLETKDANDISLLLDTVFSTYPTPVEEPDYILELMSKGCQFAGAFHQDKLVALTAAYPERQHKRCEMTDCASQAVYRGLALTERLLQMLETKMKQEDQYTFYTLARATQPAINRVFYKAGYRFQGRLIKNCDIAGAFEDMNLWVKY